MRLKDMGVPRRCALGDQVYYTHRATAALANGTLKDVGRGERYQVERALGRRVGPYNVLADSFRVPRGPGGTPLHRWVEVWPCSGYATVIGMTYRSEGRIHFGDAEVQGWLQETNRYPLYQLRTGLTDHIMLVPPWACVPVPSDWLFDLDGSSPPWPSGTYTIAKSEAQARAAWEYYVATWFTPGSSAGLRSRGLREGWAA